MSSKNNFRHLYTDVSIALTCGALISVLIELLNPGLMSSIVNISALWALAVVIDFTGISCSLFSGSLDRLQQQYVEVSLALSSVLLLLYFSLQYSAHLLGLGIVFVICGVCAVNVWKFYDRRGNN